MDGRRKSFELEAPMAALEKRRRKPNGSSNSMMALLAETIPERLDEDEWKDLAFIEVQCSKA